MLFEGLLSLSTLGYTGITLLLTHITIAGVTIFLHRHQSHRALSLHPAISHFFRFWLWLTTGMVTKEWVAIHRKHHAKCETPEDPHSPRYKGLTNVLFKGAWLYRKEALNQETLEKYGHNTPDDWVEHNIYSRFPALGISLMAVLDVLLFGAAGLVIFAVQMLWIPFWAAGVINGVGHRIGYRNFETTDASTNIVPWGILIGGEELHNNHHAFASSAKFSTKSWEFDIGWLYISLFEFFDLAKIKKIAPTPKFNNNKPVVDDDTVSAVITNRLHVMSDYARVVIGDVYKEEMRKANVTRRRLLRRGRKLLSRADALLDQHAQERLQNVLAQSDSLNVVYDFRQRLQTIWQEKSATSEMLVQHLQEWCHQAEETGIEALQEFSRKIRAYTLEPQPVYV